MENKNEGVQFYDDPGLTKEQTQELVDVIHMNNKSEWWDKEEYVKDGTMGDSSGWDIPKIIAEASRRKEIEVWEEAKNLFVINSMQHNGKSLGENLFNAINSKLAALKGEK